MAGFRRLCGRFRRVGVGMVRRDAEGVKFRRLRRFGALCRWVGRIEQRRKLRAHAHEGNDRGRSVHRPLNQLLNGGGGGVLPEGQKGSFGGGQIVYVSFKK